MNNSEEFYDAYLDKLISDYAFGNKRVEKALQFALGNIPNAKVRILDLGFGLGWFSQEILRHFPDSVVDGIDISPSLVDFAERLCDAPRASFQRQDLTQWLPTEREFYDAVIMLGIYEHIPVDARPSLHVCLKKVMKPDGLLVLTCPSKKHQDNLRKFNPDRLHPVDEDVTEGVAEILANDLGLQLLKFEAESIWNKGDYNHICIGKDFRSMKQRTKAFSLQSQIERRARLLDKAKIRVHGPGVYSTVNEATRLCIATPKLNTYSETFIRDHICKLPFDVLTLSGPELANAGYENLLRQDSAPRCYRESTAPADTFYEEDWKIKRVANWLRREQVEVMLAEYGQTGVEVMGACQQAGVPLVVHFHGYDAYSDEVLWEFQDRYCKMFGFAEAVIGVSTAMCRHLIALGVSKEKIQHIPYLVDPSKFDLAKPQDAPSVLLAVGRFVEKKAPHLTLLAFAEVLKEVPEARLEMAGDGPLLGPCQWLARSLGITEMVTFHGVKDHAWVANRMQGVRAFVQHSVTATNGDSEGTPVAVLESQCSGLPVIATRHAGIADVVVEGKTGFLCNEGDTVRMTRDMATVLKMESDALARMAAAARARIESLYSQTMTMGRLVKVISQAAQARHYPKT